jgi:hypothetical protein
MIAVASASLHADCYFTCTPSTRGLQVVVFLSPRLIDSCSSSYSILSSGRTPVVKETLPYRFTEKTKIHFLFSVVQPGPGFCCWVWTLESLDCTWVRGGSFSQPVSPSFRARAAEHCNY